MALLTSMQTYHPWTVLGLSVTNSATMAVCRLVHTQYYERLSDMLQLAANIPHHQQQHGMAVAVLLGSSVQRPREVYCLHFPPAMHPPGETAAATGAVHRASL